MDGGAYLPFLPLFRTLSRLSSFSSTDGRTGRTERVTERGCCLRTIFRIVCGDGGGVRPWARTTTSFGPQRELAPARLVIHRQTSAQNSVRGRGTVQTRSGILAYFCTPHHWLWITVELHITGARHEEADARERGRYSPVHRVSGSEPRSLRTHRHCGRSRPLSSAVVEYQAPSASSGLTPTLREDWSCKRALKDRHQPTGPHGHVFGTLV